MTDDITIRRAETPDDYRACQDAQRRAWGLADESYVVPIATLVGAQLHGGLVLGAFLPGGEAVGISFAFLGKIEGRSGLYSQLTGVVPGHQGRGIGSRLKHAQRDHCREEGLPVIAWAFDPMQAGNAKLNLQKLGATARRVVRDMYGPRTDALNAGVTTDRLIVEWECDAESRPETTLEDLEQLPRAIHHEGCFPFPHFIAIEEARILLEIPVPYARLRAENPVLADMWKVLTIFAMGHYFERGYRAVGFATWEDGPGMARGGYVLERDS